MNYVKPTYNYTMILPESFYGMGSFLKWTRVGQALSYKSSSLFIVWVAFSSKQKDFDYNGIDELWERGQSFDVQNSTGVTIRSIMYWAKEHDSIQFLKLSK